MEAVSDERYQDEIYQQEAIRLMEKAFQKSPAELQKLVAEKTDEYEYFYRNFYAHASQSFSLEEAIAGMNKVYFELMAYRAVALWRSQYLAQVGKEFDMGKSNYRIPIDHNTIILRDNRSKYLSGFLYFPMFDYDPAPHLVVDFFPNFSVSITDAIREQEMIIAKHNPAAVVTAKNYELSKKRAYRSFIVGSILALAGVAVSLILSEGLDFPFYAGMAALWAGLAPAAAIAGYGKYSKCNAVTNYTTALKHAEGDEKGFGEKSKLVSDLEKQLYLDIGSRTVKADQKIEKTQLMTDMTNMTDLQQEPDRIPQANLTKR